ncbi:MAG: hypothetical protein JXR97_08155 [Planctomycetes bacterium]|nr:hypothetical protein [Planctomycetota bacterium]
MRKIFAVIALLGSMAFTGGCISDTKEVHVNKDGSGTITITTAMNKEFIQMMQAQMGAAGGKMTENGPNIEKLKAKVSSMGEGVTFVEAKKVKTADGNDAQVVVYKFDDISKIRLSSEPDMDMPMAKPDKAGKDTDTLAFSFKKGATPELTISFPQPDENEKLTDKPENMETPEIPEAQMQQMKQMYKGCRIWIKLSVEGKITETNATHKEKDGSTITLMDMNVDKLVQNDAEFKKAMALGKIDNVKEAEEKMKDIKSFRLESQEKVTVKFQ